MINNWKKDSEVIYDNSRNWNIIFIYSYSIWKLINPSNDFVVFLIVVILCIGELINERISRKPISSEELESLIRNVSFSQSHSEIEKYVDESNLFDFQKEVLIKIASNYDIGCEARKALASELISTQETKLIKSTNKTDVLVRFDRVNLLVGISVFSSSHFFLLHIWLKTPSLVLYRFFFSFK